MAKERHEILAESVREIGILLLVFAPLDTLIRSGESSATDWWIALGVGLIGGLLIYLGVEMEAER